MGIVYFISVLAIVISFILIKKTKKEISILSFSCITITVLLCYNAFVCYVLTFIKVPITLLSLSVINFVLAIVMTAIMVKKKEVQKYKFDKVRSDMYSNYFCSLPCSFLYKIWLSFFHKI